MLKTIFDKKRNASPVKKDGKADKPLDANQLLEKAQSNLQALRVMQPSDPEAFPLVNEPTRYGTAPASAACCLQVFDHMLV